MVNFRIISKIIGSLLFIEALFMSLCALISFLYHEDDLMAFLISLLITFGSGFFFLYLGRHSVNSLSRRDAYLLVTAAWVVFSFFGMFPFLIHGCITNVTDAFFESTSGFTTTGASIIDDVEVLPHAILFWRSLTQWIGGLGIVIIFIGILIRAGTAASRLYKSEAREEKIKPNITNTLRKALEIYLIYTAAGILLFILAGLPIFDAINLTFTSISTGGMSIKNANVGFYQDSLVYIITMVLMILGATSFSVHYNIVKTKGKSVYRDDPCIPLYGNPPIYPDRQHEKCCNKTGFRRTSYMAERL